MIKEIKGDLLNLAEAGQFDVIVHGCNCHHAMRSGIAGQISRRYSEAVVADNETIFGDRNKLGTYSSSIVEMIDKNNEVVHHFTIVNGYTQFMPGSGSLSLDAIKSVFKLIARDFNGLRVGIPLIGAGIAGGNWDEILPIIKTEMAKQNLTIVHWDK